MCQDHLSKNFWSALVCGTVPIVVAKANIGKFVPADNAFLQVHRWAAWEPLLWLVHPRRTPEVPLPELADNAFPRVHCLVNWVPTCFSRCGVSGRLP